ncbi:ABC transporter permease [Halocatena salina]|uniref:ABC transporter permease n=1 Tax=Halocatena salina TaxID=2934340 RepID=A0A8U0A190_9EURY|nr:ABC transporter permease [Halocatena salina]UPM42208.1 ABC transporter permease [Halocatena salina]
MSDVLSRAKERLRAVLERSARLSAVERILISTAALVLAVLVGAVLILVSGRMTTCTTAAATYFGVGFCYDPVTVFDRLFFGALGDPMNPLFRPFQGEFAPPFRKGWSPFNAAMAVTLRETTVLVLTGLSVALAFRSGVFNIGTQGQLVAGALASALGLLVLAPLVPGGVMGTVLLVPTGLGIGAVAGGLYGAIPGVLKAYADANEVITTIMLNFVAAQFALYLVSNHFQRPDSQVVETVPLPDGATIPSVVFDPRMKFSLFALAIAIGFGGVIYYLLRYTTLGYDLRTSGLQPTGAEYGGVKTKRTIVASLTLSGALGGLGGAMYVMMILGNFQTGVPSYGFDGITVAILAGNNPLGVLFAAPLFGIIKSGAIVIDTSTSMPPQLVDVLRGLIVLFVAMPEFFRMIGRRTIAEKPNPDGGEEDA